MRRVSSLLVGVLAFALSARADESSPPPPVQDNSFLLEEAYNQEAGVIQTIQVFQRANTGAHDWVYSLTQEWPAPGQKHQLSFTLPIQQVTGDTRARGAGDLALNYRYQLVGDGGAPLAIAPRLTLLAPTGDEARGLGAGGWGIQIGLPASAVLSEKLVGHFNVGGTWTPGARNRDGEKAATLGGSLGASAVYLATPTLNLMLETLYTRGETVAGPGRTESFDSFVVSPGFRFALNLKGGLQVVSGFAVPIGMGPSAGETGLLFYLSFEHPLWHAAK
jgi:hypothetical protein